MFLLFVGCDGGPGGLSGESPRSLDGVKVLSKPADYSYSQAVGDGASENYYNLFSRTILHGLYSVYEDIGFNSEDYPYFKESVDAEKNNLPTDVVVEHGSSDLISMTYEDVNLNSTLEYYLHDSLRYTVDKITTIRNENDEIVSQTITLDLNSAWNWSPEWDETGKEIVFKVIDIDKYKPAGDDSFISKTNDTLEVDFTTIYESGDIYSADGDVSTWTQIYDIAGENPVNYQSDYVVYVDDPFWNGAVKKGETDVTNYWYSPYYQQTFGKVNDIDATNYYQDMLEYATYLFVLGYDYKDGNGQLTAEDKFFNLEKTANGKFVVADIQNPENKISVAEALGKVKALYNEMGGYVGVNDKNKTQIAGFIKDKVIGENAYAKNTFVVTFEDKVDNGGVVSDALEDEPPIAFNRNYDQVIENIIRYACEQAPIGYDEEAGVSLNLDQAYLASEITDYAGDYFFQSYEDDSDENLFGYIEAAEYQSMVFYPQEEDFGKPMTDLWLAFEYYDYGNAPGKTCADSITINVGFRYFDKATGTYAFSGETQIVVQYGLTGAFVDENGDEALPDKHWVYITDFEDVLQSADNGIHKHKQGIHLDTKLPNMSAFNKNIGGGVLNPFPLGDLTIEKATKVINGTDNTREYYKLNDSSTYGAYGSLNEAKFSVANAGDEACDFMEVYFDINKQKGVSGINYNFKVSLVGFFAEEEA